MQELLDEAIRGIVQRYRIDGAAARDILIDAWSKDAELRRLAGSGAPAQEIARTRAFRSAVSTGRRKVYYALRRYIRADANLDAVTPRLSGADPTPSRAEQEHILREAARTHASTMERLPTLEAFHRQLFDSIDRPRTVLDVGCGLYPLVFPFDGLGDGVQVFAAVDRDPASVGLLEAYARSRGDGRLRPMRWDLEEGWDPVCRSSGVSRFDVALLLKLIPVVKRRRPELMPTLLDTPARVLVITGSREALAKRREIEARERAVLLRFAEQSKRPRLAELSAGSEFGWVLGPALA